MREERLSVAFSAFGERREEAVVFFAFGVVLWCLPSLLLSCVPKCPLPAANACRTTARSAKASSHGRPRGSNILPKTTSHGHLNET